MSFDSCSRSAQCFRQALALATSTLFFSTVVNAAPLAFVMNQGSSSVSVIDTATDQVVRTLQGEGKLGTVNGAVANHAGTLLFIVDAKGGTVNVVDIATDKVRKQIAVGDGPEGIGISPSGNEIAACIEDDNRVTFIDAQKLTVTRRIATLGKNPEHCEFSSNGRWLLTSNENSDDIDIIDLRANKSVAVVKTSLHPRGIAFLPNRDVAYVAAEGANVVDILDVGKRKIVRSLTGQLRPAGAIASADGKLVYITNGGAGSVSVIDVASEKSIAEIQVGKRPWNSALTRDGKKLYVPNGRSNSVSVIDTAKRRVIKEIAVGKLPWGVIVSGN